MEHYEASADGRARYLRADRATHQRSRRLLCTTGRSRPDSRAVASRAVELSLIHILRPPWRDCRPSAGERVIELEPGRAFGTGLHETTSLIAEVLALHVGDLRGSPVLDVGTGSGILALVAIALGATLARAIDVDPDAVLVTRENAERNGLASRIHADDAPIGAIVESYRNVVANIDARTLVELAPLLVQRVAAGGRLVLSGILTPEAAPAQLDDVKKAYAALQLEEVRRKGEWIAIALRA